MTNFYENKEGDLFVDPIVTNHTGLTKLSNEEGERRHAKAIKNAQDPKSFIYSQIVALEQTITPRRFCEALLLNDLKFISDINQKIIVLREKLNESK